ncbi:unnamed protein product [Rhizoctonia solani]|uniref:Uncharacterized protein n=1 Tax=Rhizoctonia solani TaxID=456999 RepID=A0A8H3BAB6_9AGAM|nr:unnamed protein product [Rhizoctonia solani]
MASDTFTIELDLIDKNSPEKIEVLAVDRSILRDQHIAFILDSLPAQSEARIDQQSVKSYIGIDLFYGKDHNVKGLVFVARSRALVVRVPDNTAQTSAARYEKKLLGIPEDKPKPTPRTKGRRPIKTTPERTYYERLRQLLDLNLVAFGMAQISLTLWDTLRERVEGINLSTAIAKPEAPPPRAIPDPNSSVKENESNKNNGSDDRRSQGKGGREGRGGHRGRGAKGDRGNGRGRGGGGGGRNNGDKSKEHKSGSEKPPKTIPIELPEDKEECWDRPIMSPGQVVRIIYPKVSPMDINAVFVGQEEESNMMERVAEAISRGWVAYIVANHDNFNLRIQDAPVIKPSRLNDEELTFFSKSMVAAWIVMGEGETDRPIEREDMKAGRKNEIVSQSHKKRIRASKHQEIRVRFKDGEQKTFYAKPVFGNAKAVKLTENELTSEEDTPKNNHRNEKDIPKGKKNGHRRHVFKDLVGGADEFNMGGFDDEETAAIEQALFDMENVDSFKIFGRAQLTMSEQSRDLFILRLLEGRGALRGPEYQDCEFIRRIWFPTPAQTTRGKQREIENAKKIGKAEEKGRFDWVDDSWGDETDEEEAARALKNKVPESELIDYDTEDSDIGGDFKAHIVEKMVPKLKGKINESQEKVIGRVTAPNPKGRTRATLVHGPPGTGKTSTITGAAIRLVNSGEHVWIVAQSNVGIGNVAGKLLDIEFTDFILIVSEEYFVWSEAQYRELRPYLVRTTQLKMLAKRFQGKRLVLCTLAALSNPLVENLVMYQHVPLKHLIIDEASQIDMTSQFMHLFFKHRYALKNICWFGDPKQLPPYGWSESVKINDIFQVEHLQANSKLMDTSYRLPVPLAKFISKNVYNGQLKESPFHKVKEPTDAILFIDTPKGIEEGEVGGTSSLNRVEAEVVVRIAELYYNKESAPGESYEFDIITPYDAQRRLVEGMLKARGINKEVYNVDSFQGREADYIITTLTKTTFSSFLTSVNRLNVLLTRCKKGLVVVTQKEFVRRTGGLLLRLWWEYENDNIWTDAKDVMNGYVDLPGSPAPNERPEGESEEEESESE